MICDLRLLSFLFFFFNVPATTEIYTLSLHDALPISLSVSVSVCLSVSLSLSLAGWLAILKQSISIDQIGIAHV